MGATTENSWWQELERIYLREKGLHGLARDEFAGQRVLDFMSQCSTADWLDLLELIGIVTVAVGSENFHFTEMWEVGATGQTALDELNYRLREAGGGYQIEGGRLIRADSQYVHAEVVRPALSLPSGSAFEGPRQEFIAAHQHYRAGEHRQAVAMAANALESTLKAVFDQKGWTYNKGARISDLIKVAKANQLWPDYLDNSFDQLTATLQSGLPRIRDNDASHG